MIQGYSCGVDLRQELEGENCQVTPKSKKIMLDFYNTEQSSMYHTTGVDSIE